MWEALNRGEPWGMGEHEGVTAEHARQSIRELGNVCLGCDEFFNKHRGSGPGENEATTAWPSSEDKKLRAQPILLAGELALDD